jgi:hypothetical protein
VRIVLALLLLLCGCPDGVDELLDSGPGMDAARNDAGSSDASPEEDAASLDAAPLDAALEDAEALDAEPQDAEPIDSGDLDGGSTCTPDLACATNPGAPCRLGVTRCSGDNTICIDDRPSEDGAPCANGLCAAGECLAPFTISNDVDLTTDILTPQRTCAEAPQWPVVQLGSLDATVTSTPSADCLAIGDELLLINLQGTATATIDVGRWELLQVAMISGLTIEFTAPIRASFGDPAEQRIALVRVPRFGALSIVTNVVVTAQPWDGTSGGVVALRAGSFTVEGTISAEGLGYRSGRWSRDSGDCDDNVATEAGESITGPAAAGTMRNGGGSGGLSALNNLSFNNNTPICSTAGHAEAGVLGLNPNGRTLGEPGEAYGVDDGARLTMGSGPGGNLTCEFTVTEPILIDIGQHAGGIVLLIGGDMTVTTSGRITASALTAGRDIAASGGYVLLQGRDLDVGDELVTSLGALALGGAATTAGLSLPASPGYVVLSATGTVTGTTAPAARVIRAAP